MTKKRTEAATAARKRIALEKRVRAAIALLIDQGYEVIGKDRGRD